MGWISTIFKAITAALSVWKQEREIRNKPEMVKNALDQQSQVLRDKLNEADRVAADPNATPEQHAEALRQIRLAHS